MVKYYCSIFRFNFFVLFFCFIYFKQFLYWNHCFCSLFKFGSFYFAFHIFFSFHHCLGVYFFLFCNFYFFLLKELINLFFTFTFFMILSLESRWNILNKLVLMFIKLLSFHDIFSSLLWVQELLLYCCPWIHVKIY